MQIVDSLDGPRFDSRGLPEGFDPHKFYEYRLATLLKDASPLESFAYKLMPLSVIKSFAFALDPTAPFKVAPHSITTANRTKWRQTASVLQNRSWREVRSWTRYAQQVNFGGHALCYSPYMVHESGLFYDNKGSLNQQPALADKLRDTTSRTRLMGSEQGELEYFKGFLNCPGYSVTKRITMHQTFTTTNPPDAGCSAVGGITYQTTNGSSETKTWSCMPSAGVLSTNNHATLRDSEIAFCKALAQKNAIQMLKGWSPFIRDYTLFRNAVELRDIARSARSLNETMFNLGNLFRSLSTQPTLRKIVFDLKQTSKDIPNEYLSFHFGWKQTFKDLVDLLEAPAKIQKKINFLIKRSGKPTTFRSKRNFVSGGSGVPGFVFDVAFPSYGYQTETRVERETELRLVINSTFDFPPANAVSFRSSEFWDRIGIVPRPTDLYNLVPWTWLFDWFTGFGNYVELIDNMNRDPSLINWGMITAHSHGRLISEFSTKVDNVHTERTDSSFVDTIQTETYRVTGVFDFECQTRNDVANILAVNRTSVPTSLTTYQQSILGALLSQRAQHTRASTFRPSS